jgi:hypothetical protein
MEPDDYTNRRLTIVAWLFMAPFLVSFFGLRLVFVGLIARHNESSAHWGIWRSIIGLSRSPAWFCAHWQSVWRKGGEIECANA